MTAAVVILLVLLILWVILSLRVGGVVEYSEEGLTAQVRVGPFYIKVFPPKPKKKRKGGKGKKSAKKPPPREKPEKKGGGLGLVRELLPLVLQTVGRFRRKVRVAPLELLLTIPGTEDPAQSAIRYGQANAILGALWPALNTALDIRDGRVGTRVDFTASDFQIYLKAGVSLRIGQALWLAVRFGALGLVTFLQYRGKNRKAE